MNMRLRRAMSAFLILCLCAGLSACVDKKESSKTGKPEKQVASDSKDKNKGKPERGKEDDNKKIEKKMTEEKKRSEDIVKFINFGELPLKDPERIAALYGTYENALFIGDSRTEGFRLYSGVNNATFYCAKSLSALKIARGGAVSVNGKEMTLEQMLGTGKFPKIYISLGLNEMGRPNIDGYIADYTKIIEIIKEKQPEARIFIQALIPVSEKRSAQGGVVNNEQIYWYNVNLVKIAEQTGVRYVNPDTALVDDTGALKPEASTDGIHLTAEYCKVWAQYLAQISLC